MSSIRELVPQRFILGIKFNAGDYLGADSRSKHHPEDLALEHVCAIAAWGGIDFIEISGGDYEDPGQYHLADPCFSLNEICSRRLYEQRDLYVLATSVLFSLFS